MSAFLKVLHIKKKLRWLFKKLNYMLKWLKFLIELSWWGFTVFKSPKTLLKANHPPTTCKVLKSS